MLICTRIYLSTDNIKVMKIVFFKVIFMCYIYEFFVVLYSICGMKLTIINFFSKPRESSAT